jgi:hypothetical protein
MSAQEPDKRHVEVPFIMIPLAIARIRSLSGGAKLLFGAIYSLSHLPNGCHCSNESLATRIGLSTEQVRRLLRELESRELIVRTLKDHGRSDIQVVWRGKPIKMSDKKSGRPKGDTKCIGGEGDTKCPDKKYPPPRVRASASGDFNEKKKKRSEPSGSESVSSKKKPPNARPGDASAVQKEEEKTAEAEPPFDLKAFRESIGLKGPVRANGITLIGDPRPVINLEDAPVKDDPIIQAELAARKAARKESQP